MSADDPDDRELMLSRFQRLIVEIIRGSITRNVFQPWEVEILVDIETCNLDPKLRIGILRQYLRTAMRRLEIGTGPPMKLSEFLQLRRTRLPFTE
jgi:hypothetical protein